MSSTLNDLEELLDKQLPVNDIKSLLESLSGMFLDSNFSEELISKHFNILLKLTKLIVHKIDLAVPSLNCLINITSHSGLLKKFVSNDSTEIESNDSTVAVRGGFADLIKITMKVFVESSDHDIKIKSAQLLSNLTRESTEIIESNDPVISPAVNNIIKFGLCSNSENEQISTEAALITLNLSRDSAYQNYIINHLSNTDLLDLCLTIKEERLISIVGIIKNLLKHSTNHKTLLDKTDLLTILLHPLVGLNDYEEKISSEFPENLKFFLGNKNEASVELRLSILEALYLLSGTKCGRETMRSHNVYDILKNISELDLTDEESDNCLDCIGLLIRTEDEIDCDDILQLKIPKEVLHKFKE